MWKSDMPEGLRFRTYVIDKVEFEKMCLDDTHYMDIARHFNINKNTLYKYVKQEYGCSLKELKIKLKENGLITKEVEKLKVDKNGEVDLSHCTRNKIIPPKDFEKLCAMQCTKEEICGFFECTSATLSKFCEDYYGMPFKETYEMKRQKGLVSLRRNQMKLSERSSTMNIFLSKNLLGMTDKTTI